jgi:hypothetical protein
VTVNTTDIKSVNISLYSVYSLHVSIWKDHQVVLKNIYMSLLNCSVKMDPFLAYFPYFEKVISLLSLF